MIKIMLKKNYEKDIKNAKNEGRVAFAMEIRDILKSSEGKVFLDTVTLTGDATVRNSMFIGCNPGLFIEADSRAKVLNNLME